ncbi:MAG: zf-HC2 domain-containing protein, partial [Proteobacteria bacterium]|nr:zf-HC2 domain-containing protein [Pseudomonadota bacterium]
MKMETDECKQLESIIDLYLDGQLSSESRSALERHLSNCPLCLRKLEGRRMLVKRIHQAGWNVEVPPHLAAKTLESARGELQSLSHSYRKWMGLAAALLLVIMVSFWFYTQPLTWKAGQI